MEAADLKLRSGALMSLSGCGRGLNGQRSEVRAAPLSGGKREDGFYRCCCREPCRVVGGGPEVSRAPGLGAPASFSRAVVNRGLNLLLTCRIVLNMPGGSTNQTIQELKHLQSARPLSQKADFLGGLKCLYFSVTVTLCCRFYSCEIIMVHRTKVHKTLKSSQYILLLC